MQNTSKIRLCDHAFGTILDGRTYGILGRVGFGGQEKDDEINGAGNTYTAEYWEYDSRLGRRWNVDPVTMANVSPFAAFSNNPIFITDITGAVGEPNRETGELKAKVYLKQGESVTSKDFNKLVDNFVSDLKKAYEGKTVTNAAGKEVPVTINVNIEVVSEAPKQLKNGENYFEITTTGISHVNADKTTGIININDFNTTGSNVIAHEFGHFFGLQDRYFELYPYSNGTHVLDFGEGARQTVPMSLTDPGYDPYNNMYSTGNSTDLTKFQMDVLFGAQQENPYASVVLFKEWNTDIDYTLVKVVSNANKIDVTSWKGAKRVGVPIWATKNASSSSIPFNCKDHGKNAKKAVKNYLKTQ